MDSSSDRAPAPHIIQMWEQWRLRKQKYEAASESESKNNIPGFDTDIDITTEMRQEAFQYSSSRECEAETSDGDDSEVSPESFAFAIDDILEQILGSVHFRKSLFSCRLVSRRWRAVCTKVLKRKDICISLFVSEDPTAVYPTFKSWYEEGPKKPAMSKFMSFLNKSYTQGGSLTLDSFPCNALKITDCSLNYPELQDLLDVYGEHLRYLYISSEFAPASQSESNFIKQLEHLLGAQAPNIERLNLKESKLKSAASAPASTSRLPSKTASESNTVGIRKQNLKLRRLTLKPASRKVIDSIVAMCPNLNQIDVNPLDFHVLVHPTNLFHLVREFRFDCRLSKYGYFQLPEADIVMSPEERKIQNLPPIKCTTLSMDLRAVADLDSRQDVRLNLVRIINYILESSWDTLEHIYFSCHTGETLLGLKWPRVLPKVERLYSQPNCYGSCGLEIFPLDGTFKIQDTFPRVKNMILYVTHDNIKNSNEVEFLMKRRLGPVTSVTDAKVTVLFNYERYWEEEVVDEDQQLCFYSENLLSALFPNVAISLKRAYI